MKNVLIVSFFFPPYNSIASKRYGTMAKYMESYGFRPYILTIGAERNGKIPIDKRQIIRIAWLEKISSSLTLAGLLDKFKIYLRTVDFSVGWYNDIKKHTADIIQQFPEIDIVIGTYGPMANVLVARYLARKYNVPWILEIRDLISLYLDDVPEGYRHPIWIDSFIEKYISNSAAGLIPVTKGYKNILNHYYFNSKKTCVIYNGWENNTYNFENQSSINTEKYIYYAGRLYEHRLNSLYLLIKAVNSLRQKGYKIKVKMRITIQQESIKDFIHNLSNEEKDSVELLPSCQDEQTIQEKQNAHINVVFSDLNDDKDYLLATIPGKLMELLCFKPPILVIASPHCEMKAILDETKKGIVTNGIDDIENFIINGYKNCKGIHRNILRYSRKYQAAKLCRFLKSFF